MHRLSAASETLPALLLITTLAIGCHPDPEIHTEAQPDRETQMSTRIQIAEEFVEAFNRKDVDAVMSYFAPDPTYHNLPTDPVSGTDAVRAVIESYVPTAESIDWEITHIAESGDTVLTERIDRFVFGGKAVSLPVMGAFDFEGDKIVAWRDYFDQATWDRQMSR